MANLNVEPMVTFADGTVLVLSTQYVGDSNFRCELYHASPVTREGTTDFRIVTRYHIEAASCLAAQDKAYVQALDLYRHVAEDIKKPPYLIWHGPNRLA